jgi:polyisoprenoid-binding protein YceI
MTRVPGTPAAFRGSMHPQSPRRRQHTPEVPRPKAGAETMTRDFHGDGRAPVGLLLRIGAALGAAWLAACAVAPQEAIRSEAQAPPGFPEGFYAQAAARSVPVYRVDPAASLVVVEVRRGGSLARLGHDHVVASHDVRGYVAPDEGRADLYVHLDRLVVDEPPLRAESGFDSVPTAADIVGTRENMLKGLDAGRHPFAVVSAIRVGNAGGNPALDVAITLHGTTANVRVPIALETGGGWIEVSGRFDVDQTAFGITPLAILGGAIAVQDRVSVRFRVRAVRVDA